MGCALSCLASAAASCCCSAATSLGGTMRKSVATRTLYAVIFMAISIIAFVFSHMSPKVLEKIPVLKDQCSNCYGPLVVFRVTFGFFILHLLLMFATVGVTSAERGRSTIHNGFWMIKLLFAVGLVVASFFIPNNFFIYYGWFALGCAVVFILVQLVLLVDFAYKATTTAQEKFEETSNNGWYYLLLGATVVCYAVSVTLVVLMYVFFCGSACELNAMYVTITLVATIVLSLFSIFPKVQEYNPRAGLLQAAIVTLYAVYVLWSALNSHGECVPFQATQTTSAVIGIVLTFIAVLYSTLTAASSTLVVTGASESLLHGPEEKKKHKDEESGSKSDSDSDSDSDDENNDEKERTVYSYSQFHFIFALGYMYIAMVLTDWTTFSDAAASEGDVSIDSGYIAFWIKLVTGWIVMMLYGWTLIAPIICPDREWN